MKIKLSTVVGIVLFALAGGLSVQAQGNETAVVQAVLFYYPTCPHCHEVIQNDLPPLQKQYGDQLQILLVDASQQSGALLYQSMVEAFSVPDNRIGVPTLVVDDAVLVGSLEIPEQFPQIIASGLETGGISWPAIPGLEAKISQLPQPESETTGNNPETSKPSESAQPAETPPVEIQEESAPGSGFALAWAVLIGILLALIYAAAKFLHWRSEEKRGRGSNQAFSSWSIPVLAIAGLGISGYLAYVEISQVKAICGPVGECNLVQSSEFARIAGIPIAVLGIIFYSAIMAIWVILRRQDGRYSSILVNGLIGLTILGTIFSLYLTAVELFVIEAVCAWCLSSAIITTALLLIIVLAFTRSLSTSRPGSSSGQLSKI